MKHSNKIKTIKDAMLLNSPTIGTMQREKGRVFTEAMVMGWLVYLNELLNLNKPMSEDQIEMCATEILNDFYALKFSDLTLLFKKIISGSYGEFYESLSIPKVLSFFRDYFDERCDVAVQESEMNHKNFTSDETFNYSNNVKRYLKK
ncbi:hypothetical protein [Seonamhaeicola sp.]|uniref:hypothetical protein n=1 Tax=Seonamhaeicola sp. TaxID=1912245 RepID=UPI0035656A3B